MRLLLGKIFFKQLLKKMRKGVVEIKLSIWKVKLINYYLESLD